MQDNTIETLKGLLAEDDQAAFLEMLPSVVTPANVNDCKPDNIVTLLGMAASTGSMHICRTLIEEYNADPQAGVMLPLELAVISRHPGLVRYLKTFTDLTQEQQLLADWFIADSEPLKAELHEKILAAFQNNPQLMIGWACYWEFFDELVEPMLSTDSNLLCAQLPSKGIIDGLTVGYYLVRQERRDIFFRFLTDQFDAIINVVPKSPNNDFDTLANELVKSNGGFELWNQMIELMQKCPSINLNQPMLDYEIATDDRDGDYSDITIPWWMAHLNFFDALSVAMELTTHPVDVTLAPIGREDEPLIYLLAKGQQWVLVEKILATHSDIDVYTCPEGEKNLGQRLLDILKGGIENYRSWNRSTTWYKSVDENGVVKESTTYSNEPEYKRITQTILENLIYRFEIDHDNIPQEMRALFKDYQTMICFYASALIVDPRFGPEPLLDLLPMELRYKIALMKVKNHFNDIPLVVSKRALTKVVGSMASSPEHQLTNTEISPFINAVKTVAFKALKQLRLSHVKENKEFTHDDADRFLHNVNHSIYQDVEREQNADLLQGSDQRQQLAESMVQTCKSLEK